MALSLLSDSSIRAHPSQERTLEPVRTTQRHRDGVFNRTTVRPPVAISGLTRFLSRSLHADAARAFEELRVSRRDLAVYETWSRTCRELVFSRPPDPRNAALLKELCAQNEPLIRAFRVLELAHALDTRSIHVSGFGWSPFSMFQFYNRPRIYPVILPMWDRLDWSGADRMPFARIMWRLWGPFAHSDYTASLLGNGEKCAVLDPGGIFLYDPISIFDERQRRLLSTDLVFEMQSLIASQVGIAEEPDRGEVPERIRRHPTGRRFATQLHRAAAKVWTWHRQRRRCQSCGEGLKRTHGGNTSATCGQPECVRSYERQRKRVRRFEAHIFGGFVARS